MAEAKKARLEFLRKKKRLHELREKKKTSQSNASGKEDKFTKTGSAAMGAAEGITFGLIDEVGALGIATLDTFFSDKPKSWKESYYENRDNIREQFKQAAKDNPKSFMAGDVAGSLVLPGGLIKSAGKQVFKQASKQALGAGAKAGAAQGFGRSEEKELIDIAKDTAIGAGAGLAGGGVGATGIGAKKAAGGIKKLLANPQVRSGMQEAALGTISPRAYHAAKGAGKIFEGAKKAFKDNKKDKLRDVLNKEGK